MSESRTGIVSGAAVGALACLAGVFYATALDRVPIHLHHDEIYFGLIADSVARTLRDPHGRFLPVLFQMGDSPHWYPPLLIYLIAAWLKIAALSDSAVRTPNALIGIANVVLIYFTAKRMFGHRAFAVTAAAMLLLTPAHFINSRIATDITLPITFILLWLLLLLRYLEHPTTTRLVLATAVLGIGVYGYIASVIMMPVYLLITLWALHRDGRPRSSLAVSIAGFAAPLVLGLAFVMANPDVIANYAEKYQLSSSAGPHLNLLQQAREAMTPWNISDHLNLFYSSFAPGYLFVTGGSNIAHSTRLAGIFLAPLAVLLLAGLIDTIRRPTTLKIVLLAGFLTAPLAATIVPEEFAAPRMLGLLPFGVLLATVGLQRLWNMPLAHSPRLPAGVGGLCLAAIAALYAIWQFFGHGHFSDAAMAMLAAGIAIAYTGHGCQRRHDWKPAVVLLMALMPLQFAVFAADYFGDYRARSAARYEFNVRGALEQAIALHDQQPGSRIYINDDIQFVRAFWDYYLRVFNRSELAGRATWFNSENGLPAEVAPGSIVVSNVNDRAMHYFSSVAALERRAEITDPVPGTDPPGQMTTFVIYQMR